MARVVRVLSVVLTVGILLLVTVYALQRKLIYFPSQGAVPPAASVVEGARDVRLQTSDGLRLGAWFVPAHEPALGVTVLVANGNGGDRTLRAPLAQALSERGLEVLLFDYRGYAENPGTPSAQGLARDVRAARDYLIERAGVHPDRLLYLGESLGAAVVTELAADHPPAGLVLRSPFVSLAAVGREHYPWLPVRLLLRDRYPLVEQLRSPGAASSANDGPVPVTVVYGTADTIVPPAQSRAVADATPGPSRTVVVEGAGHNDLALLSGDALVDAVVDLARRVS